MKDYIESLQRLLNYDVKAIAPGHGEVIQGCRDEVEKLVRHRLMREAKVVANLSEEAPFLSKRSLYPYTMTCLKRCIDGRTSLLAHLLKLKLKAGLNKRLVCGR